MSDRYLTVYDLSLEKDWVLKNPFDIIETKEINTVYTLDFSIPMNEQDMEHLLPYHYVRYGDDGELYRITENTVTKSNESTVTYHCEHVIATLSDDVMFQGPYIKGGVGHYTSEVLNFILGKQTLKANSIRNWKLGVCQPQRQFEYSWENENLLAALWSVPTCFATPYMWTFDTTSYPWTINLVNINQDGDPNFYMMAKKNILRSEESSTNLDICTRLYGLGEGEGVNQLTIKSVNNGLPFIQSSEDKIREYGIVSRIFVDRRYQAPETLKARMQTLLAELENPQMKRTFEIVDLYDMSPDDMYKAEVGNVVLLKDDNTKVYITKTRKNWSVAGDMQITIATKATDISSSIADLADRQRIEQVYSQGASQVYSFNFSGNATTEYPLNGYCYFPEDLKYLNEVKLKVKLDPFRSYSKASSTLNGAYSDKITISQDTKTISTQTNTETVTSNVTIPATFATTEMIADENQDLTTTSDGGGTTSSSGGTSVTVSGGTTSGNSTDNMVSDLSFGVDATGIVSAPMESRTSDPSTETTSGTVWANEDSGYTNTEATTNGSVSVNLGNSNGELLGNTWSYSLDGYHNHDYWGGQGEKAIDGGMHDHDVYVNIPTQAFDVRNNLSYGDNQKYHVHGITLNSLHHEHNINHYHTVSVNGSASGGKHTHTFTVPNHTHTISSHSHKINIRHQHKVTIPKQTVSFQCPKHTHSITIQGYEKNIEIPNHQHDIVPGIFTSGNPTTADLLIDDVKMATITQTNQELDITQYLLKNGKVPRGQWMKISIKPTNTEPNNMAFISVFGNVFAFIQSYTGGNY